VAPSPSHTSGATPSLASVATWASSCAQRASVSSGPSLQRISSSATARAAATARMSRSRPGRTIRSARRCSSAWPNSTEAMSRSRARATSQSCSRFQSPRPQARQPARCTTAATCSRRTRAPTSFAYRLRALGATPTRLASRSAILGRDGAEVVRDKTQELKPAKLYGQTKPVGCPSIGANPADIVKPEGEMRSEVAARNLRRPRRQLVDLGI
jgi:hypothetical protein